MPDTPMEAIGSGAIAHAGERETIIITTPEELEAFSIVKAIACSEVKPLRIVHRDQVSYFAILLDDNNRKTIARLLTALTEIPQFCSLKFPTPGRFRA